MGAALDEPKSICVFSGASILAPERHLSAADRLGRELARRSMRLIYGGGGLGLMGACARSMCEAGGEVLGVMPEFLRQSEGVLAGVKTIGVTSMHERKAIMFAEADAFVVLPGGIGTLEETIELLSWRRLELHSKPMVICNLDGYWTPLLTLMTHTIEHRYSPASLEAAWSVVTSIDEILPALVCGSKGVQVEPAL